MIHGAYLRIKNEGAIFDILYLVLAPYNFNARFRCHPGHLCLNSQNIYRWLNEMNFSRSGIGLWRSKLVNRCQVSFNFDTSS